MFTRHIRGSVMRYPIIKVRDNCGRRMEHIVGENSHDLLYVDSKTGSIHYLNSQCMAGTKYPEEGYSFIGEDKGEWSLTCEPEIEMVSLEKLIDMASEHLEEGMKAKIESYRALKKHWNEEMEKARNETGIGWDTGGFMP